VNDNQAKCKHFRRSIAQRRFAWLGSTQFSGDRQIMSIPYFIVKPEERERPLNVVGTKVTVLASNAATQSLGITLQQGDEGTGPPPHRHDWDECFYVLKGEMEFFCEGTTHKCMAGTLVYLPRGTLHGFRYGVDGQALEITGNGALAAQMFTAIDDEIPVGPPDIPKLLDVLNRYRVTVALGDD
jgi:quercetin dioxygenase-like cupin family protein